MTMKCDIFDTCFNTLEPYKCHFCGFTTNFRVGLQKHVGTCSLSSLHQFEAVLLPIPKYEYTDSTKEPIDQSEIVKHLFNCPHCSYGTNKKDLLMSHIRKEHTIGKTTWYHCDQCSYKSTRKYFLFNHKSIQHTSHWFKCKLCDYKTKTSSYLTLHRTHKHLSHDQINWIQCSQCDYKAKTKIAFQYHNKIHEDNNWLHCDQCEYKTKFIRSLKSHQIARHAEEDQIKWFKCNQCEHKTKWKMGLERHKKTMHTWYNCDQCDYRARYKVLLTRHSKIHENSSESWFQCDQCDYRTYLNKTTLGFHMRSAHPKKHRARYQNHKCDRCPYVGKRRSTLTMHKYRKHPEIIDECSEKEKKLVLKCGPCQCEDAQCTNVLSHLLKSHLKQLSNGVAGVKKSDD